MSVSHIRPHRLAIKSAKSIVPGYGADGAQYGLLVPSTEILAGIRPRRRRARTDSSIDLPASWLESLLGFESIATTHVTHRVAAAAVASGLDWPSLGQAVPKPATNHDLDAMVTHALGSALEQYARSRTDFSAARSIVGHIHISATSNAHTPYALLESRRVTGCHKPGLPIINLLSGCSGLLHALHQARFLLQEDQALADDSAFVVITCSNDMLPFAHARGRCPDSRNESIDDWLFQAIFGEGVGAIVVGHAYRGGNDWVIEDMDWGAVTDDWRVTMSTHDGFDAMTIRAREVAMTFREHVPRAAKRGLSALGDETFPRLHRLIIHESNPNLVSQVATKLTAPAECVHSLSAKVGTLAGVSAFSLLDEALQAFRPDRPERDSIVCALIGESGNSVVAGHIALRYAPVTLSRAQRPTGTISPAHIEAIEATA